MSAIPATRRPRSVESLQESISRVLDASKDDVPPEAVLDLFRELSDRHDTDVNSPYNMGYFCIDADVVSLAALYETDRRGANVGVDGQHPASAAFEHFSINVVLRRFGIDTESGHAHYTSGGTESNLTAMVVALGDRMRHSELEPSLYDPKLCSNEQDELERYEYFRHGTVPLKRRPTVYVSAQTHPSFRKNARTLIGTASVRQVSMNRDLGLDAEALDGIVTSDKASGRYIPFMVIGTVGATESGIIDPLEAVGRVCKKHRLWFHVDAPWGGIAAFSDALRQTCLAGLETADSITFDPHKTLVPLGSGGAGMFLTRHRIAVARSFNFMNLKTRTFDYPCMSLQGSRVNTGLRVLVQLAGPRRLARRIEYEASLGDRLRRQLKRAGWLVTNKTPLPIVCTAHPSMLEGKITSEKLVKQLALRGVLAKAVVLREGQPSSVRLGIISRRTREADVDAVVAMMSTMV